MTTDEKRDEANEMSQCEEKNLHWIFSFQVPLTMKMISNSLIFITIRSQLRIFLFLNELNLIHSKQFNHSISSPLFMLPIFAYMTMGL